MNWTPCLHTFTHLSKTKVSYKKSQRNAVNACGNRMCKLSFTHIYKSGLNWFNFLTNTSTLRPVYTPSFYYFDACIFNLNGNDPTENAMQSFAFLPWSEVMNIGLDKTACKYLSMVLKTHVLSACVNRKWQLSLNQDLKI